MKMFDMSCPIEFKIHNHVLIDTFMIHMTNFESRLQPGIMCV